MEFKTPFLQKMATKNSITEDIICSEQLNVSFLQPSLGKKEDWTNRSDIMGTSAEQRRRWFKIRGPPIYAIGTEKVLHKGFSSGGTKNASSPGEGDKHTGSTEARVQHQVKRAYAPHDGTQF